MQREVVEKVAKVRGRIGKVEKVEKAKGMTGRMHGILEKETHGRQKGKARATSLGHATGAARLGTESQTAQRTTPLRPLTR